MAITALAAVSTSQAVTIVTYPMDTSLGAATPANGFTGAGAFTTTRGTLASSTVGALAAVTTTNWATAGGTWGITLNLTGWENVTLSGWSQQASNTGPRDFAVFASYNGGTDFTELVSTYAIINGNSPQSGFALGAAADENASVVIEWRNIGTASVNGSTIATTGTSRFSTFSVSADAIPEPSAALLGGLGLLALLRRRR